MCFATRFHCLKKTTGERNSYARKLRGQKEELDEKLWAGSELLECVTGWIADFRPIVRCSGGHLDSDLYIAAREGERSNGSCEHS